MDGAVPPFRSGPWQRLTILHIDGAPAIACGAPRPPPPPRPPSRPKASLGAGIPGALFSSLMTAGALMLSTYTVPLVGFAAVVPQFEPPWSPGSCTVPAQCWRRKQAFIAPVQKLLLDDGALFFGQVRIDVVHRETLARERRRSGGKRLRGPGLFSGNVGLRHFTFFNRPDRACRSFAPIRTGTPSSRPPRPLPHPCRRA